ncbi:MAG: hypothetical protein QOF14_1675 [Hyphomicrobiales bacterium]|nr:hypothetical protein [Hyphomicrobiales bacterium]
MASIHKAFMSELAKTPRLLLLKLIKEKLSEHGLANEHGLAEALTDHFLSGGGDTFNWDDGRPSGEPPRNLALLFSEEDVVKLEQLTNEFLGRLPALIENTSKDAAERLVKTLQRKWPEQAAYENAILEGFRGRLEARWGRGFDLLRMLLTSCRELGEESAKRLHKSRSNKNCVLRSLLVRLHARACQITAEIITLMENGFADGAMARWRTLHEVSIIATVISDGGETLAQRYIEHEVVESKFAMDEYARCHVALGYKPIPARDRRRVERAFGAVVKAYGDEFGKPYGWAATYLKKKRVTFRDLEDSARRSAMRSYYKMASYNVHADTPKSIFFRLGVIGDQSIVVAGATDAGFTEPAQNAAITLVQITALLIADRVSNLDVMIKLQALNMICDKIPDAFMRAERKLKRDHKRMRSNIRQ